MKKSYGWFKSLSNYADFMFQSIPALTSSPPGDPRGFAHPFCPAPQGFTYKFVPGGQGLDEVKVFQKKLLLGRS